MPTTERLYYDDSHLIEFEARVVERSERVSGWTALTLDRTAFYPTGGGQPSDTGTLDGQRVVECIDDAEHGVLHVVQGVAPQIGSIVKGRVDWPRRLDHIQQHTGQHILSQAFVTLFQAPTHSFRVLEHSCEIDVELSNPSLEIIERAVELANNVIWEDRRISIQQVTPEEAAELPLRKDPARHGELRLIEIADFDLTPCGGTHARRTGEVGMIAMRSWERAKGLTRIEFVAGVRALADYRRANRTARSVAALFSGGRDDAPALAEKMLEENKELRHHVRALEELTARVEADDLLAELQTKEASAVTGEAGNVIGKPGADSGKSTSVGTPHRLNIATEEGVKISVVAKVFENRDAESLKRIALALIKHPQTVALLGSTDENDARLVFARSADAPGDMGALMRKACEMVEGRGGGKSDMAQGGGKKSAKLREAIAVAEANLVGR
ncbi:MAG TPA: DHHA1 domain-containing protein [Pyrinomonadaceae bacterium]|nr:DHHA1 domain-containing protein [Pyrinomonadaceae bacterium]